MPSNNKYFHCLDIQTIRAVSYTACLSYSHSDLAEQWAAIDIDLIVASCKTLTSLVYLRVGRYIILYVHQCRFARYVWIKKLFILK